MSGFSYDSTLDSYTVTYSQYTSTNLGSSTTRSLVYTPNDIVSTIGDFIVYSHPDSLDASHVDKLELRKPTASGLTLTYVSYGVQTVGDGIHFQQKDYFIYGQRTSPVPIAGTADYTGTLDGTYNRSDLGQTYQMAGSATLHADFGAATISTEIKFTGTNVASGGAALPLQEYSGTGSIIPNNPDGQFVGMFSRPGSSAGYLRGNFYGDNAEEFGMSIRYNSMTESFVGVAVGKR